MMREIKFRGKRIDNGELACIYKKWYKNGTKTGFLIMKLMLV
jgi:hypothetical protein